jgi:hypothetical protein
MIHEVTEVRFGVRCKTTLWLSQKAREGIDDYRKKGDPDGAFWKKIKRYAINGFDLYERGRPSPVLFEWDGVFRVSTGTLFRLYGFYSGDSKSEFIVVDVALKRGMELSKSERSQIDEVARVRREGLWKKVQNDNYPKYTG